MMRSIRELKRGRKNVFEEINRNKIRLMNAINKGKYRDDNEKRKIINRIDEVQAELRLLSWKKKKKQLDANKKEGIKITDKLYRKKYRNNAEKEKLEKILEDNEKEAQRLSHLGWQKTIECHDKILEINQNRDVFKFIKIKRNKKF